MVDGTVAEQNAARIQVLGVLLQEHGNEIRSRRDPEHIYTAAFVGAVGALAWGVATIGTISRLALVPWWRHPAIFGALGCMVMAFFVIRKIRREYRVHLKLRGEQNVLARSLAQAAGIDQSELPQGLQSLDEVGLGHHFSIWIVVVAAFTAGAFCLSVWL
jgi:hypothetical protein